MKFLPIFLTLLFALNCTSQDFKKFKIQDIVGPYTLPKAAQDFAAMPENQLFEDEKYVVTKTCSGEWGGTIKFLNKNSGITYAASATCPISVNKIKTSYYVSSSLRHIGTFSEFIRIDDPEKLEIYQQQPESSDGKLVGSEESHSNKGTVSLMGGQFVFEGLQTSFVYNDSIYYILCDDYETFLAKIENKKIVKLETILKTLLCGSVSPPYKSEDNHLIVPFYSDNGDGYFDIFENEIIVRSNLKG